MELFASLLKFKASPPYKHPPASCLVLFAGVPMNIMVDHSYTEFPHSGSSRQPPPTAPGHPYSWPLSTPPTPYWANAFVAQVLQPISFGALLTVGLIVITDSFAKYTQALAGAVFDTPRSLVMLLDSRSFRSLSVVSESSGSRNIGKQALNRYHASFWIMFGSMVLCAVLGFWGLLRAGKVGLKQD